MNASILSLFDLSGRAALVTGAAHGIGKAVALGLARHGADVAVCDLDVAALAETAGEIEVLGRRAFARQTDVGDAEQVGDLFSALDRDVGPLDILVNNVGLMARARPEEVDLAAWNRVLATGVTGSLLCAQQAGRRWIASGRPGAIVNVSSIAGVSALGRGNVAHSVNKGALNMLTKELAIEWAKHRIRVNAVLPCQVLTEQFQRWLDSPTFDPALYDRFLSGIPLGRLASAEEIVGPVVFLVSDAAAMVTGTLLAVDGGNLALNAGGTPTWTTA